MISDLDYFDCVESLFYKTWVTEWLSAWPNPTSRDPSDLKSLDEVMKMGGFHLDMAEHNWVVETSHKVTFIISSHNGLWQCVYVLSSKLTLSSKKCMGSTEQPIWTGSWWFLAHMIQCQD